MCSMKKLGLSNYFKIGLKWFRLYYRLNQSFPSFIDFLDSCNFCTWFVDPLYTPYVLGCSFFDINKTNYFKKKKS